MHHSSGCLPDQHHGLWGVCPTHPSTSLLPSWVHLQLWDRRSEVTNTGPALSVFLYPSAYWITVCNKTMFLFMSSITYNGSMESPVPLYPTDCPPPYEAVMGQRAASQVSICLCICYHSLCVASVLCDHADVSLLWLLRPPCLTPMALSCRGREELPLPSVEKVRKRLTVSLTVERRRALLCNITFRCNTLSASF